MSLIGIATYRKTLDEAFTALVPLYEQGEVRGLGRYLNERERELAENALGRFRRFNMVTFELGRIAARNSRVLRARASPPQARSNASSPPSPSRRTGASSTPAPATSPSSSTSD